MRLACVWPPQIGLATLEALARHPNPLAATPPVKVPRGAVRGILAWSALTVGSNRALGADAARRRARVAGRPGRTATKGSRTTICVWHWSKLANGTKTSSRS